MRFLLIALFLGGALASPSLAQTAPTWLWSQQIGGPGDDYPGAIAIDATGNTVATGFFEGTVQVGTTALSCPPGSSRNFYVAKYDATGAVVWARRAGDGGPGTGYAATSLGITTDGAGNVYIVGDYTGTLTFGSLTLTSTSSGINAFVVKYSAAGVPVWAQTVSGPTGSDLHAVAVDGNENVLVAGTYAGTVSFGAVSLTSRSTQDDDAFVAKYNRQGVVQWARSIGGSSSDNVSSVQVDAQGNAYVAGSFASFATLGGQSVVSNGLHDVFLAKYDAQGGLAWAKSYGGAGDEWSTAAVLDAAGNAYLAGSFTGTAAFGPATAFVSQGGTDGFVVKCDGTGNVLWGRQVGGPGTDELGSLALAPSGDVYLLGSFEGTVVVGSQTLASAGTADVVLARVNAAGTPAWAVRGGGTGYEVPRAVACGANGRVAVLVGFGGTTQFGPFATGSRGQFDTVVLHAQDNTPLGTARAAGPSWQAYPNPFSQELTLTVSPRLGPLEVRLLDATGRAVLHQALPVAPGVQSYHLPMATSLAAGLYWLQVTTEGRVMETRPLVKLP